MKISALTFLLLVCFSFIATAQDKVRKKDVIGKWKLVIDIEDELEDAENELDDDDNVLGEIILSSVSGLVTGIIDEIDIYMEFRKDGELKTVVEAFGEREIEYSKWWIDGEGRLQFSSDSEHFSSDNDEYWLLKDGLLISYTNDHDPNKSIYMVNID